MITLSSTRQAAAAVRAARAVVFTSYILRPGAMMTALEEAARGGADVVIRLDGRPFGDTGAVLADANRKAVRTFRKLGADAAIVDSTDRNGPPLHMKAAVCDGVAYLDDRNWPGKGDTIVRDDFASDVAAIRSAALYATAGQTKCLWTSKIKALAAERRLLAGASNAKRVSVESESFGRGSGTYGELKRLAQSGVPCRLIVAKRDLKARSAQALQSLSEAGVAVRVADADEKMAIVDGKRAWLGSANASSPYYDSNQIDWGLRTDAPGVVRHLNRRFETNWRAARPFQTAGGIAKSARAFSDVRAATSSIETPSRSARQSAVTAE